MCKLLTKRSISLNPESSENEMRIARDLMHKKASLGEIEIQIKEVYYLVRIIKTRVSIDLFIVLANVLKIKKQMNESEWREQSGEKTPNNVTELEPQKTAQIRFFLTNEYEQSLSLFVRIILSF